jgi:hypothetical protein
MRQLYKIHSVTIGSPHGGAQISKTMDEARELGLDYVVFNGVLLPVGADIPEDYLQRFPQFTKSARLMDTGF